MSRQLLIYAFLILISDCAFSQYKLDIEITGISNNSGKIMLQLLDEKEKVITQEMNTIKDEKCFFSFIDLKAGKYAIRYYHDENMNGKMDTNMIGKPTEGYGFSNNVTGRFGPPPFEKWLFELNENKKITLKPAY
jgi:uncharacterized protein (DUF2141 family)